MKRYSNQDDLVRAFVLGNTPGFTRNFEGNRVIFFEDDVLYSFDYNQPIARRLSPTSFCVTTRNVPEITKNHILKVRAGCLNAGFSVAHAEDVTL